ncbi:MAG: polysaccharide deacetylase family protein [Hydrogenobaculum sp.]
MGVVVFCYHKIFPKKSYDVNLSLFQKHIKILDSFYEVLGLEELKAYLEGLYKPKKPGVVITFDDGYADNFIYAYPILKKYKKKAIIFPIYSRLLKEDIKRPTLFDYWEGKVSFKDLYKPLGAGEANREFFEKGVSYDFLSFEELRSMLDVFDVGSHGLTHSKTFIPSKPIDIYSGKNYHYSLSSIYNPLKEGLPIYPSKSDLSHPKAFITDEVYELLEKNKDKNLIDVYTKSLKLDFETENQYRERIRYELKTSKEGLEKSLGIKIISFAYPFGDMSDVLKEEVSNIFYMAFSTKKKPVYPHQDRYDIGRVIAVKDIFTFIKNIIYYPTNLYKYFNK